MEDVVAKNGNDDQNVNPDLNGDFDSDSDLKYNVDANDLTDESETESDEEIHLDNPNLQHEVVSQKKTRGQTVLHDIQMRSLDERKLIILNEFGQPVGPITDKENTPAGYSRFLGTIALDYSYAPLIFKSWHKVPNKEKMWEYALSKYIVADLGKTWTLQTIGSAWRLYKCRFKKKHYRKYADDNTRWANRSKQVPSDDFLKLLAIWKTKAEKKKCKRNREIRLAQKNLHTTGPKSFAIIREEMKNENPSKEPPSLAEMFERTRQRKEGKSMLSQLRKLEKKFADMKNYVPSDDENPKDPFIAVMGKEKKGRLRLRGRSVSEKKVKKVTGGSSYVMSGAVMDDIKASLLEEVRKEAEDDRKKLVEMYKVQEEENLKRRAELLNMQAELESQRATMTEDILTKIIEKIPLEVTLKYLCTPSGSSSRTDE